MNSVSTTHIVQWTDVARDGNCFYASLCVSMGFDEISPLTMRKYVVKYIAQNSIPYEPFFFDQGSQPGCRSAIKSQGQPGEFAEGAFIQAAADCLEVTLFIHEHRRGSPTSAIYTIEPRSGFSHWDVVLRIDIESEHYQALKIKPNNSLFLTQLKNKLLEIEMPEPVKSINTNIKESESEWDIFCCPKMLPRVYKKPRVWPTRIMKDDPIIIEIPNLRRFRVDFSYKLITINYYREMDRN
jgi:hypothetical protein